MNLNFTAALFLATHSYNYRPAYGDLIDTGGLLATDIGEALPTATGGSVDCEIGDALATDTGDPDAAGNGAFVPIHTLL